MSTLREGVKLLGSQPGIGRLIDDMPNEFREWILTTEILVTSFATALMPSPSLSSLYAINKKLDF
jgi:hypothetical protein